MKKISPPDGKIGWSDRIYAWLTGDRDQRVITGITETAGRQAPGNYLKILISHTLTSVGDKVASAKTTLPWVLSSAGAPAWCLGLLVPIRESGSMLPQLVLGAWVRRLSIRKTVWVAGSVGQGLSLVGMGWAVATTTGTVLGIVLLLLLALFSVARAASSLAHKDVLGKTIPKTRRGRLSGWISAVAGLVTLGVGALLGGIGFAESTTVYVALLLGAAGLWFVAALIFSGMVEEPGEVEIVEHPVRNAVAKLRLLVDDRMFRRFVIARALAMGSGLAAPFYVALARDDLGAGASMLGLFIVAEGLAGLVSSPLWGRWADRSSRAVFATACVTAAMLSLGVAAASWLSVTAVVPAAFYGAVFFGLGVAHAGVRMGRKIYLVDLADGNRRTDYVAVSNTVIGGLLLFAGAVGALTALVSIEATLVLLGLAGLGGAGMSLTWKDVSGPESP